MYLMKRYGLVTKKKLKKKKQKKPKIMASHEDDNFIVNSVVPEDC